MKDGAPPEREAEALEELARLFAVLDTFHAAEPLEIISGLARGADTHAVTWARRLNRPCLTFPAEWAKHGKRAGPIRNQKMLDDGDPEIVIAFHNDIDASKGTADMVRRAKRAGIPVYLLTTHDEAAA